MLDLDPVLFAFCSDSHGLGQIIFPGCENYLLGVAWVMLSARPHTTIVTKPPLAQVPLSAYIIYGWPPLPSLSPAVRSIGLAATLPHAFVNWSGEKDEKTTGCTVNEASLHSTPTEL